VRTCVRVARPLHRGAMSISTSSSGRLYRASVDARGRACDRPVGHI
jgi:hypothetical protein